MIEFAETVMSEMLVRAFIWTALPFAVGVLIGWLI